MLKQGEQYSASDFIELKKKVKNEMLRRRYTGSLSSYGGEGYDFTVTPEAGKQITTEQANKIIEPMTAISYSGMAVQNPGDQAKAMDQLHAMLAIYESAPLEGAAHCCRVSCSGLCYTGCSAECTGGCEGDCGVNCSTGCLSSCVGSCSGVCQGGCVGGCGGCDGGCYTGCGASCLYTCSDCGGLCSDLMRSS